MKPLFGYMGGKQKLAKKILPYIPEHTVYVEPFCGSAAIFFAKSRSDIAPSKYIEVLNDLNGDIVNLFDQLRKNPDEVKRIFSLLPYAKDVYYNQAKTTTDYYRNAPPAEKAALFLFNVCGSFTQKINGGFAFSKKRNHPHTKQNIEARIMDTAARLKDAYIFNDDYKVIVKRFDSPDTFFYFDPPYKDTEKYSGVPPFDYDEFEEVLRNIRGRWILSHYYDDFVKRFEGDYKVVKFDYTICIGSGKNKNYAEAKHRNTECIVINGGAGCAR